MGLRRFSQGNSSRKQEKSWASRLTSPAAEPLAAAMQLVKLQEYFYGTSRGISWRGYCQSELD